MNQKIFEKIKTKFNNYVSQFSLTKAEEQQNIDLKYKHSYQVCKMMKKITADILTEEEKYIAQTIALLHDIGRFKQYEKYKTFADAKSEDHAQLGVNVIQANNFLAEVKANIKELILKAIKYHNNPYLPEGESTTALLYTKLIRDADKLDIWRVVINEYKSSTKNEAVGLELSTAPQISAKVYQDIMEEQVVKYEDLQTLNDFKLLQMGWVFDINFAKSFVLIKENKYIEELYNTLPQNQRTKNIYNKITSYLKEQIN